MEKVRPAKVPVSIPKPQQGSLKPPKKVDQHHAVPNNGVNSDQGSQNDKYGEGNNAKKAKGSEQGSQHDANEEGRKLRKGVRAVSKTWR